MQKICACLILLILCLQNLGCQLLADELIGKPKESSSSCAGPACADVPHTSEGFLEKWTNRGSKSVALRVPLCNGGRSEKILSPGQEHRVSGWCSNYEAYYDKFPDAGTPLPMEPKITSFKIEPAEVTAEVPSEYNLRFIVLFDERARLEGTVYFSYQLISGSLDSINGRPLQWVFKVNDGGLDIGVRTMKKTPTKLIVTAYNSVSTKSATVTIH